MFLFLVSTLPVEVLYIAPSVCITALWEWLCQHLFPKDGITMFHQHVSYILQAQMYLKGTWGTLSTWSTHYGVRLAALMPLLWPPFDFGASNGPSRSCIREQKGQKADARRKSTAADSQPAAVAPSVNAALWNLSPSSIAYSCLNTYLAAAMPVLCSGKKIEAEEATSQNVFVRRC